MGFIRSFIQLGREDNALAGGKGASLGEMTQAGIPVPGGFVILADAFDHFLDLNELRVEIDGILHEVDHQKMHTVEHASELIQELIINEEIPEEMAAMILSEFETLRSKYVAVRSSATAEDSHDAAWAGQLSSYLNTTKEELLLNVKKCWASLFTPRAIFYRFEKGLHGKRISVAVVVQKMVQSEISGIAFSVHPVTEDYNQLIIEAGLGLGEAIVSGQITPDSYVVEKSPRKTIEKNVAEQERGLYRLEGGKGEEANEWKELGVKGAKQKLSDKQIDELTEIILRIENHYGFPCDIEWAFEKGKFYITQSRPITTLKNLEVDKEKIVENGGGQKSDEEEVVGNIRKMHWERWLERPFFGFTLSLFEGTSWKKIGLKGVDELAQLYQNGAWYFSREDMERADRQLGVYLEKETMFGITGLLEDFKEKSFKRVDQLIKDKSSLEARFAEVYEILSKACTFIWLAHGAESYFARRLKLEVPKYVKGDIDKFIGDASLPDKKNSSAVLDELMRSKASDKEVAKVAGWVKVRDGFSDSFTAAEIAGMRKDLQPVKKVKKVVIPKPLVPLFSQVRELVFFRTERTDVFYQLYFRARPILKELAEKHKIPFKEMTYYRAKSFIEGRLEKYGKNVSMASYNGKAVFKDGSIIEESVNKKQEVSGVIAFKGVVRGVVKIVKDVSDLGKVGVGDILVTQMTFPSFIPAMVRAVAFVTDEGGITCHAAIVAREMQKPCIIGTKNATRLLHDGDLVEVDADKGVVRKVEEGASQQQTEEVIAANYYETIGLVKMGRWSCPPLDVETWMTEHTSEYFREFWGFPKGILNICEIESGFMQNYIPKPYFTKLHDYIEKITRTNYKALQGKLEKFYAFRKKAKQMVPKTVTKNLAKATNGELIAYFKTIRDWIHRAAVFDQFGWIGENYWIKPMESFLIEKLGCSPDDSIYHEVLFALTKPEEISTTLSEKRDVLREAISVLEKKCSLRESAKKLAVKYGWMPVFTYGTPWGEEHYLKELKEFKKEGLGRFKEDYRKLVQYQKIRNADFEHMKRKYGIKATEAQLFIDFGLMLDVRNEAEYVISFCACHLIPIYDEIARRLKISVRKLRDLFEFEVEKCLKGEMTAQKVLAEKGKVEAWGFDPEMKVRINFSPEESERLFKVVEERAVLNSLDTEGKGICASPGRVRGKVRIVHAPQDQGKVEGGDILFSVATTVDYLPSMKKAAAIVTEVGGLTCHAAVVSREFGIPCVVSLNGAMSMFKDGDLVEVDADRGVVRKVEGKVLKK